MTDNKGEIIIYIKEDGRTQIDVKLQGDSLWLSQRLIAKLFEKDVNTINDHIRNIYEEKELTPESTTAVFCKGLSLSYWARNRQANSTALGAAYNETIQLTINQADQPPSTFMVAPVI
jgi:hypothetical protein